MFKLIKEEFSEEFKERQWTYELEIVFNYRRILKATITDHPWKKPSREMITKELILKILNKSDKQILKVYQISRQKQVYKWETAYQSQRYRLIFWYKDNKSNHLWVRNCYPIN